jgi:hypothetical protein
VRILRKSNVVALHREGYSTLMETQRRHTHNRTTGYTATILDLI